LPDGQVYLTRRADRDGYKLAGAVFGIYYLVVNLESYHAAASQVIAG
jgi:hypothetical protein